MPAAVLSSVVCVSRRRVATDDEPEGGELIGAGRPPFSPRVLAVSHQHRSPGRRRPRPQRMKRVPAAVWSHPDGAGTPVPRDSTPRACSRRRSTPTAGPADRYRRAVYSEAATAVRNTPRIVDRVLDVRRDPGVAGRDGGDDRADAASVDGDTIPLGRHPQPGAIGPGLHVQAVDEAESVVRPEVAADVE